MMDEKEHIIYSAFLHKTMFEYNAIKYNSIVSKPMMNNAKRFISNNRFVVNEYKRYSKEVVQLRSLYNFFIKQNSSLKNIKDTEFSRWIDELQLYKNTFLLDIEKVISSVQLYTEVDKLYMFWRKGEISWYSFYFIVTKCNNFNKSFLEFEMIKRKVTELYKLSLYFKHFDEEWVELNLEKVCNLQKIS